MAKHMTNRIPLVPILEALDATIGVMPWGVSTIPSCGCVILWDSREDADAAIMAAIARDQGGEVVEEAVHTCNDARTILGAILKPSRDGLDDYAGDVRTAYVHATGIDPNSLEEPF
jgi:hypothetical protein